MKARFLAPRILEALSDTPVVLLQGPRQCGKTTLVQNLNAHGYNADYITMDDAVVLAAAESDPDGFVAGLPEKVIIDEIQRVPSLFLSIKKNVDKKRHAGRFLLTGSANAMSLPKVADSLAGRIEVLRLWPYSQGEIEGYSEGFIDQCFAKDFKPHKIKCADWSTLVKQIVTGGFPEIVDGIALNRRQAWFGSYITSILERDVRDIANIHGLRALPDILRLVAARPATVHNMTELARDANNTPLTTLQRYWSILETVFLVEMLPAWRGPTGARISKSPKMFLNDTGMLCSLLGFDADQFTNSIMAGPILENFITTEIMKQSGWNKARAKIYHFRTPQNEVDLVLENPQGKVVGIEIKRTSNPDARAFKGLKNFAQQVKSKFHRGILLYNGSETVAFDQEFIAVPVSALWHKGAAERG